MKTKKSKLIIKTEADINFKYEFTGYGCSKAYLKAGDTEVFFPGISYLCLPITDLLSGLLSMIDEWAIKNTGIRNDDDIFIWKDEPGGYRWKLKRYNENNIRVIIESLYGEHGITISKQGEYGTNSSPDCNKIVLNSIVNFKTFLTVILKQIDNLIKEYGLLGFRANWDIGEVYQQFPLSQFLELKYYLLHNKILYINIKGKTKNWSLKKEIQLLNAEI
jgi:hypothetical protein